MRSIVWKCGLWRFSFYSFFIFIFFSIFLFVTKRVWLWFIYILLCSSFELCFSFFSPTGLISYNTIFHKFCISNSHKLINYLSLLLFSPIFLSIYLNGFFNKKYTTTEFFRYFLANFFSFVLFCFYKNQCFWYIPINLYFTFDTGFDFFLFSCIFSFF